MIVERFQTDTVFNGYAAADRPLKKGDKIILTVTWAGTVHLYPADVSSVTSTGPDQVELLGDPDIDFEFFPSDATESSYTYTPLDPTDPVQHAQLTGSCWFFAH